MNRKSMIDVWTDRLSLILKSSTFDSRIVSTVPVMSMKLTERPFFFGHCGIMYLGKEGKLNLSS